MPSGLYSASSAGESIAATGYANVWARDNIYVAFVHHVTGARHIATEVVKALIGFFTRYCHRSDDIISGAVDPQDVAIRPHVRFDGRTLSEIGDQRWVHAQHDALGYFLVVVVNAGRERRADAGRERRLGAHTSRASAWRPLLLSSPLRVSGGFDDGDRGVISSKSPSARR